MKEKILEKAIELLNEKSIKNTSFRDIASALSVSDGHVRYYFKTKEKLLVEIFNRLDQEVLGVAQSAQPSTDIKKMLLSQLESAFTVMARYRFIFYEAPATFIKFPKLQASYKRLLSDRKTLFLSVFKELISIGFFRSDFTEEKQEKVFYSLFVFSDSWMRYDAIMNNNEQPDTSSIQFHSEVAFSILEKYIN